MLARSEINSRRKLVLVWGLGLILSLFAAWNSAGIAQYDEHFQILEFINYKLGYVTADRLPWEFAARMRSWFQPWLYFWIAKTVTMLKGNWDPFAVATSCRIFSAGLGWLSLLFLWRRYSKRTLVEAMAFCFFGFFLFEHARTSGENLSGSFLALALSFLPGGSGALLSALFSGVLLGISFECRYQIALALIGILGWLLIVRKAPWQWIISGLAGFGLVLLGSLVVDHWGYGTWCFPPWAYFRENALLGKASGWGTQPVWFYLKAFTREPPFGLGILVLLGWALGWILAPLSVTSWTTFVFFIGHTAVGHKEARFLAPIVQFAVPGLFVGIDHFRKREWAVRCYRSWLARGVLFLLLLGNAILVIRTCFFPFSTGLVLMEDVFRRSGKNNVIFYKNEDPALFYKFEQTFYTPEPLNRIPVKDPAGTWQQQARDLEEKGAHVFFYDRLPRERQKRVQAMLPRSCQLVRSLADDGGVSPWLANVKVRALYECKAATSFGSTEESTHPL